MIKLYDKNDIDGSGGGSNLLKGTSDTLQKFTGTDWTYYSASTDEPVAKHQVDGKEVTLSAWIENPSKEAWVQMWTDTGGAVQGNKIPAGGSGWSQVTFTIPNGFGFWNIVVGCGVGSGTITLSYSNLKLELGSNRTDGSQSTASPGASSVGEATTVDWPDWPIYLGQYTDFTQADSTDPSTYTWSLVRGDDGAQGPQGPTGATGPKGDTGSTGFFIGTTPPPNPTKGTVWATADSDGNMTSAKTWNGSDWVSTAFTQDLVAGNITATKIQGGELDIDKITVKNAQNIPITSTVSLGDKLSQLEQNANELSFILKKGHGSNLLKDADTMPNWTGEKEKVNQFVVVKAIKAFDGGYYDPIAWNDLTTIKPDTDYTLSFWAKADKQVTIESFMYNIGPDNGYWDGNTHSTLTTEYQRLIIHFHTQNFTAGSRTINCIPMRINTPYVNHYIYGCQLEEGTAATDWSSDAEEGDDVAAFKATAEGLDSYIRSSRGSQTLASLLSMDPDNSTIAQVVNGKPVAAINMSHEGNITIDGTKLHITAQTTIDDASIKSSKIESLSADKITTGTLDAAHVRVINLDANSITTGSLRAALYDASAFETYTVSPSNTWDFNFTKSTYANWFLKGETTADHVYNGPSYAPGKKLTPYMYVTSRGTADSSKITVTVWKDNDPTQYQRVWDGDSNSWSEWVMLPNSQNIVSTINLSKDGVKISGKNIELDGNTTVTGRLDLMQDKANRINQSDNYHNNWNWNNAHIYFDNYLQLTGENCNVHYTNTNTHLNGGRTFYSITTLTPGYLKFTTYQNKVNLTDENFDGQITRSYLDSGRLETPEIYTDNFVITGHHIRVRDNKFLMVSNKNGTNFDDYGNVGFQVYGGISLGKQTIGSPTKDIYFQQGNVDGILAEDYSKAPKVLLHCDHVASQASNTVVSRLSVKTDITPVTYDRALAAVEGTDMYDYRYISDDSGQHYVSGIIDDVSPDDPQYNMDDMLINKDRTARIDANLIGYHHVVIQKLLERVAALEAKVK